MQVFISEPLSKLKGKQLGHVKVIVNRIKDICVKSGLDYYLPHEHSDPNNHSNLPDKKVNEMNKEQVKISKLVIALGGYGSEGVSAELTIADENNIPAFLTFEEKKEKEISKMTTGKDTIKRKIPFKSIKDLENKLKRELRDFIEFMSEKSLRDFAYDDNIWHERQRLETQISAKGKYPASVEEWRETYERSRRAEQKKISGFV